MNATKTYPAILRDNRLEWSGEAPPIAPGDRIRVLVTVPDLASAEQRAQRARERLEILDRLRSRATFAEIEDPVAWQREIRRDRPLPGREP